MITVREGQLEYHFDAQWTVSKYDEWPFYREHFEKACGGNKAVDVVAHDPSDTLWLVELKDYRVHPRTKTLDLSEEVALKVRDSVAGIFAASKWQSHHAHLEDARKHLLAKKVRVVLHLEQPASHSRLFPRKFDLAKLQQRMKQLVKSVDAHPAVVELASFNALPWTATSAPGTST